MSRWTYFALVAAALALASLVSGRWFLGGALTFLAAANAFVAWRTRGPEAS